MIDNPKSKKKEKKNEEKNKIEKGISTKLEAMRAAAKVDEKTVKAILARSKVFRLKNKIEKVLSPLDPLDPLDNEKYKSNQLNKDLGHIHSDAGGEIIKDVNPVSAGDTVAKITKATTENASSIDDILSHPGVLDPIIAADVALKKILKGSVLFKHKI